LDETGCGDRLSESVGGDLPVDGVAIGPVAEDGAPQLRNRLARESHGRDDCPHLLLGNMPASEYDRRRGRLRLGRRAVVEASIYGDGASARLTKSRRVQLGRADGALR